MRQVNRIQDDTATRPVLVSDDVKEIRCANSNSDAKVEYLVFEPVSKQRFVFFTAFAPADIDINELICDDSITFAPQARSPSAMDPELRTKNRPPSFVSSSSCGNRLVPAPISPQGRGPSSLFVATFVSPTQMRSGHAILSG